MNLRETVHTAEQQGREAVGQGFTRGCTSQEEAQSRLRRKMRIHPRTGRPALPLLISLAQTHKSEVVTQPIISVKGEDLPPEEMEVPEEQMS